MSFPQGLGLTYGFVELNSGHCSPSQLSAGRTDLFFGLGKNWFSSYMMMTAWERSPRWENSQGKEHMRLTESKPGDRGSQWFLWLMMMSTPCCCKVTSRKQQAGIWGCRSSAAIVLFVFVCHFLGSGVRSWCLVAPPLHNSHGSVRHLGSIIL